MNNSFSLLSAWAARFLELWSRRRPVRASSPPVRGALCGLLLLLAAGLPSAQGALPAGFVEDTIGEWWEEPDLLVFDETGVLYVGTRRGIVYIVENDVRRSTPLIDISQEVGAWNDYGMLGMVLHPDFRQNGFFYLYYVVDHHHLTRFGTPNYNPNANEYQQATIARITRYTADAANSFRSVVPGSRKILVGETASTGFPITYLTHGPGTLLFGADGSLLASCGDGAGLSDAGSDPSSFYAQALSEGILKPKENIGAFRSQMVDSLSGKIIRIDPATGDAIPSNPFYDPAAPRSARSRVWALGLRNPFRMTLKPGTGSADPALADPGVLYLGDVGYFLWEEVSVVTGPGMNFGWPIYEGFDEPPSYDGEDPANLDAPNPLYGTGGCTKQYFSFRDLLQPAIHNPSWPNPCNPSIPIPESIPRFVHTRPAIDWNHNGGPSRTGYYIGSTPAVINIGAQGSPVSGPQFGGNCAIGGTWYTDTDYPPAYQNSYFFADLGGGWIRTMKFDADHNPVSVGNFGSSLSDVVTIVTHPLTGDIYYAVFSGWVRRVRYVGGANFPPTAVASSTLNYGPGPLTVQFTGNLSIDPEGQPLAFDWNFGDGSAHSTAANPSHTFNAPAGVPTRFTVTLTVTDSGSATHSTNLVVSVNNSPPNVSIVSPVDGSTYGFNGDITYDLIATVSDAEHSDAQLRYEWQNILHHNNHNHPNPIDTNHVSTTVVSPVGCDGDVYHYEITLRVTDPAGLSTTRSAHLYPECDNSPPTLSAIPDQTINQDTSTAALPFTINDADTAPADLTLSGSSSNPTLVPNANILFGGSGASRTVTVTPAPGQSGVANITVTVSDGTLSASDIFQLIVSPLNNTAPFLSDIADLSVAEDTATPALAFTIGDAESAPGSLTVTATSDNPALVPAGAIILGGSNADRTVALTPASNLSGTALITVTVSDGNLSASDPFVLTVTAVNDPPTLSSISDQATVVGVPTGAVGFTVGDPESAPDSLTLAGSSDNPALVPDGNILFGGTGAGRTVTVSPAAGQSGAATITVTVGDGALTAQTSFEVVVSPAPIYLFSEGFEGPGYENPGWSEGGTANEDYSTLALDGAHSLYLSGAQYVLHPFAHGDAFNMYWQVRWTTWQGYVNFIAWDDGDWGLQSELYATDNRFNVLHGATQVPSSTVIAVNTTYHMWLEWTRGTGNNGTLKFYVSTTATKPPTPEVNITTGTGGAIQRLMLGSSVPGGNRILDKILVANTPIGSNPGGAPNTPPTLADIPNQSVPENGTLPHIDLDAADAETPPAGLAVSAVSDNPVLLPAAGIEVTLDVDHWSLSLTPAPGQSGSATVTVTVSDGLLTAVDTFVLNVTPALNTPPTIGAIADQAVQEDTPTAALAFTVDDAESTPGSLIVTASSDNPALVPTGGIAFGGSGANRTVTVTPAANQSGTAAITVTVSDGALSATESFAVTVAAVNDAPTLSAIAGQNTAVGVPVGPIGFTVGDAETLPAGLTLSGSSDNPTLVPPGGIVFGGADATRTVTVTPASGQAGTATITVVVWDGELAAQTSFTVVVSAAPIYLFSEGFEGPGYENTGWSEGGAANEDYSTTPLSGTQSLNLSGSQYVLRPFAYGDSFHMYWQARWNTWQSYVNFITWDDGNWNAQAELYATQNKLRAIHGSRFANAGTTILLNTTYHMWLEWTRGTGTDGTMNLFISTTPVKPASPDASISRGNGGVIQRLMLGSSVPGGNVIIDNVLVDDQPIGSNPGQTQNTPPTLSNLVDQTVNEDTATAAIPFTVADAQSAAGSLLVSATSGNPALVPNGNILLGGTGANRTVTVTPAPNQSGTAQITVTVSDGLLSASDTFLVNVTPVNDPPAISDVTDQTTAQGIPTPPIPFTVDDLETPAGSLTLVGTSDNPALLPDGNIVFGGSGSSRTVTLTPLAGQSGIATVTLTVGDGTLADNDTFTLTVTPPGNSPPTLSSIADQGIQEDAATGAIAFSVGDAETEATSLIVTAVSGNSTLVPQGNIALGGSGAARTVEVTPAAHQFGTALITVTVSDGLLAASDAFLVTVTAVNDTPTITTLPGQSISEDTSTAAIAFSVGDVETAAGSLVVSGSSDNPALVPPGGIQFGGSGANRTITVTPAANASGTALVTVAVSDGDQSASESFLLTVTAVNDAPTLSTIPNQSTGVDVPTPPAGFTVGDAESAPDTLTLTASSDNPSLVPDANITLGGSGASRTVSVSPASGQSGTATITLVVWDGELAAQTSFDVVVSAAPTYLFSEGFEGAGYENAGWSEGGAANEDYTVLALDGAQSLNLSGSQYVLHPFAFGDSFHMYWQARWNSWQGYVNFIAWDDGSWGLQGELYATDNKFSVVHGLRVASSTTPIALNTTYHMWFEWTQGTGNDGSLKFYVSTTGTKPASPEVHITTGTGGAVQRLMLGSSVPGGNVILDKFLVANAPIGSNPGGAQNSPPTLADIAHQAVAENGSIPHLDIVAVDAETPVAGLNVTAVSDNALLLPASGISVAYDADHWTLALVPAAGQSGTTTVTVTVSDGAESVSDTFVLTVTPAINTPPTIGVIDDQSVAEDTATAPLAFSVGDAETAAGSLVVSGTSDNPTLVPPGGIVFGGSGASRTLTVTPAPNQSGTATITLTVSDGALSAMEVFVIGVTAVNDPPTLSAIADQTTSVDVAAGPIPFTVGDAESAAGSLTVTGSSDNPTLVPTGGIVLGGSGATRTVTVTPAAGQSGTATITVTVSDGDATAQEGFVLVVSAAPTYLFSEGFEGPGYENAGWSEGGAVNEDYTSTALVGAESLNLSGSQYALHALAYGDSFHMYWQVRWNTWSDYIGFMVWDNGSWATQLELYATDNRFDLVHGTAIQSTTTLIAPGVTYHMWLDWSRGGGNNGTAALYVSTDGTKPAVPDAQLANGNGGAIQRIMLGTPVAGPSVVMDQILVDDLPIGSHPGEGQGTGGSFALQESAELPASIGHAGLGPDPVLYIMPRATGGVVDLLVLGQQGRKYVVESSDDLQTWHSLVIIQSSTGVSAYSDEDAAQVGHRFYRLRQF